MVRNAEETLREAVTLIEARLAAGLVGEAVQYLHLTIASQTALPDGFNESQSISLNAGLAWIYRTLSNGEGASAEGVKAVSYAQSALLLDPNDASACEVLSAYEARLVAHNLLRHRKLVRAKALLERLWSRYGEASEAQLLALLEYVDDEKRRITKDVAGSDAKEPTLLINAIVWGDAYVDALFTYGFPSLLAPGNLPAVANDRRILFDFYTTDQDRDRIEAHPVTTEIKRFAEFRYNIIPEPLLAPDLDDAARWCAGAAQQCSALRARQCGADLLFLCGSAVYSANCLSAVYGFIDAGYKAVVCMAPRTQEESAYSALSRHAKISEGRIEADADALSEFIVGNLHRHSRACFMRSEPGTVAQNPVALYFRTDRGFVCRTYEPNPLIISHSLLNRAFDVDYFTIDVRFISELLGEALYEETIKVVSTVAEGIAVTDVDYGDFTEMRDYGEIEMSVETCASGVLLTATRIEDLAFFRWALRQQYCFDGVAKPTTLPEFGLPEGTVTAALLEVVDRGVGAAHSRITAYDRLPG